MHTLDEFFKVFHNDNFRTFIYSGDFNLITILLLLMLIDIITGLLKAIKHRELWSRKSLFGYARKILVFLIITVANLLDLMMGLNGTLVLATVTFYILNEVLSIAENSAQLGLPLPQKLLDVIQVVQEKDDVTEKVDEIIYSEDEKHGKD